MATSKKGEKQMESAIIERMDLILKLLAVQVGSDKSITERARLLKVIGLDNRTIAEVLNTSDATVRTLTSNLGLKRPRK